MKRSPFTGPSIPAATGHRSALRRTRAIAIALAAIGFAAPGLLDAAKKDKTGDRVWTHPEIASFGVERIAMLPVSTYDQNPSAEKTVEGAVAASLRDKGYRWLSVTTVRALLRTEGGTGDSLLQLTQRSVLDHGRLDSLLAPAICGRLRCDAVLAVRVDQWEQNQLEWDQSGKPTTSLQLRAALVDTTGALLWSAAGSQTGEGPYREASSGTIGMTGGALDRKPITGQGGAPSFPEVLEPMLARWAPQFPAHATVAPDSASAAPAKPAN
jgi:hypothetical protein